jgi:hypothetical protein
MVVFRKKEKKRMDKSGEKLLWLLKILKGLSSSIYCKNSKFKYIKKEEVTLSDDTNKFFVF